MATGKTGYYCPKLGVIAKREETTVGELVDKLSLVIAEQVFMRIEERVKTMINQDSSHSKIAAQKPDDLLIGDTGNIFLTVRDLRDKIKISRSTIWRLERDGKFPSRRKISPGKVAWLKSEIEEWMKQH